MTCAPEERPNQEQQRGEQTHLHQHRLKCHPWRRVVMVRHRRLGHRRLWDLCEQGPWHAHTRSHRGSPGLGTLAPAGEQAEHIEQGDTDADANVQPQQRQPQPDCAARGIASSSAPWLIRVNEGHGYARQLILRALAGLLACALIVARVICACQMERSPRCGGALVGLV